MSHHLSVHESAASACKGFALFLLALFATELAIMGLLDSLLPGIDPVVAGVIDGLLLCFFLAWPVWFFVIRALSGVIAPAGAGIQLPVVLLWLKVLGVVFLSEFLTMQLLPYLPSGVSSQSRDLLDAALSTLVSAPFLWYLLFRRELRRCRDSLTDLLGTPFGLYVLLLYMIFVVDLLLERILLLHFAAPLHLPDGIADAVFTTLLLAPILWLFVARPLRQAILNEHARVRAVHNQLIDAAVALDALGTIESFNPAAEQIFGFAADDVVGRRADFLFSGEERDLATLLHRGTDSAARGQGRGAAVDEFVGRRRDGTAVTLEVSLSQIEVKGAVEYLLVMRDVSGRRAMEKALRESKERFRAIFEQSEDAIVFFSPRSLALIDVNATAEALFGRPRQELIAGGLDALLPAPAAVRLRAALNQLGSGRVAHLDTLTCLRPDGGEAVVSVRAKTMTIQKVELFYTTFRDITERVRLETESREIQAKLIHANKMTSLGLMVSGVAHEINNPNNLILANASLLDRAWNDARKVLRDYAGENGDFLIGGLPFSEFEPHAPQLHAGILDGSRRISAIVGDLKGFARREQAGLAQVVDINQVATTAVAIVHYELIKYTGNFHLELDEAVPLTRGSSQQLGQVVVNLLMNSCHALPDKSCGIWLTTSCDLETDEVVVSVRDGGSGMSPEVSRRVMEPFFTTRIDSGGTGLGLSICYSIVKSHQGTLTFTSTPGQGSEFIVRLPAHHRALKG